MNRPGKKKWKFRVVDPTIADAQHAEWIRRKYCGGAFYDGDAEDAPYDPFGFEDPWDDGNDTYWVTGGAG